MSILVVGSFMVDCVVETKRAPLAGETIIGYSYNTYFGGKGANQAVSAVRQNAEVYMAGMLGNDKFGPSFYNSMKEFGINMDNVLFTNNQSTGIGNITIEENGQNRIIIIPGANLEYKVSDLLKIENIIKDVDIVVTQLEMRYDIVQTLAKLCNKYHKKFILNPAPARDIDDETLKYVTYLTPNETELALITNKKLETMDDYKKAANYLCTKGVEGVVVTLGDKGVLYVDKKESKLIPSYKVKAIDTTAAGDSFTGAFAAYLSFNKNTEESLKLANAVGALTVQKKGAIPSLPTINEVEEFIKRNKK